jgi:hypothetical protein
VTRNWVVIDETIRMAVYVDDAFAKHVCSWDKSGFRESFRLLLSDDRVALTCVVVHQFQESSDASPAEYYDSEPRRTAVKHVRPVLLPFP